MRKAQNGDRVLVHFSAFLDDGTQFATTTDEDPMELTIGERKLINCFEQSVVGMAEGERKKISVEPEDAMGEHLPERVIKIPLVEVPEQYEEIKVGSRVEIEGEHGTPKAGIVKKLSDQEVTVDTNHPLAGKTLSFDIELIKIRQTV